MSDASSSEPDIWRMLGKRWTPPILKSVGSKEAMRFCEIRKALAGISGTVLSERLAELEREGLVTKNIHYSKIEYRLTASAKEFAIMLAELDRWWAVHRQTCRPVIANYQ